MTIQISAPDRRAVIKGAVSGALALGFHAAIGARSDALAQSPGRFAPNQWVRIDRDGIITVTNSVPEMGQGSMTYMPMILGEELDAAWDKIKVEPALANEPLYRIPKRSQRFTSSRGLNENMEMWRQAGAAARQMLRQAAAARWGVALAETDTELGFVLHRASNRRIAYGDLVDEAQALPAPSNPPLKSKDQFRYIGKGRKRLDTPAKVSGQAVYGIDVTVPGMLVASVERIPVLAGGRVASFDAAAGRAMPGVRHVVQVTSGVAVVADTFWAALQGRKALKVQWDDGPLGGLSSASIARDFAEAVKQPGLVARNEGDVEKALAEDGRKLEAVYDVPYLEHACMEPMNATADVRRDRCEIWAPTQTPGESQAIAADLTKLPKENIIVHTTLMGGAFGRRAEVDFVIDAVEISKAVGAPVKTISTREDDITHGFYRPSTHNVFRASLSADGKPKAWFTRTVGAGLLIQKGIEKRPNVVDSSAMSGLQTIAYDIPNLRIESINKDHGVPVGFWRSVSTSQNAFIVESFIDELAHLAGQDPFEYRRSLLTKSPRHKAVLELAAAKANWGSALPPGRARGIAVALSYSSYIAHVAEVSVAADGKPMVHRLVGVVDCGVAINPDQVKAQMEGGAIYALTAVFHGEITIERGRVQQSNFDSYPMLRIDEAPPIEIHILESGEKPGGLGEPAVPTVAPAICNAIFAATGKRLRSLPARPEHLRRA